jgi:hypothetical protein
VPVLTGGGLRVALPAALCLGLVLVWGCVLIYGADIGTDICRHYTYVTGGENPRLRDWCKGQSWRGWLASCLVGAAAALTIATVVAAWTARAVWLVPGTLLAGFGVWLAFALPQTLAGADVVAAVPVPTPVATPVAPPATSTPSPSGPLPARLPLPRSRGLAHDVIPGRPFRCPAGARTVERLTGPSAATPFDSVTLSRGADGLCATFQGDPVASFALPQYPSEVVSLFLRRRPIGDPSQVVAGATRGLISIELWSRDNGGIFWFDIREAGRPTTSVSVGDLGLANGYASLYVKYPRLPAWVLDGPVHWTVVPR